MEELNLNTLKVFLCVATSNSFLDASKKLSISQPAISKCIKSLEDELHVNLFYRGNKGVKLTPEGKKYLSYVMEAKDILLAGKRMIFDNENIDDGVLVIGAQSHIVRYYLLEKIELFKKDYPNVKVKIIESSTHEMFDSLEKHSLDLVIDSFLLDVVSDNVVVKKVASFDTCFIKSLKNTDVINKVDDLCNSNIILPLSKSSYRISLEKNLSEIGVKLNPSIELATEELIIEAVKRNLGIGFVVSDSVKDLVNNNVIETIKLDHSLPKVFINASYIDNFLPKIGRIFLRDYINIES